MQFDLSKVEAFFEDSFGQDERNCLWVLYRGKDAKERSQICATNITGNHLDFENSLDRLRQHICLQETQQFLTLSCKTNANGQGKILTFRNPAYNANGSSYVGNPYGNNTPVMPSNQYERILELEKQVLRLELEKETAERMNELEAKIGEVQNTSPFKELMRSLEPHLGMIIPEIAGIFRNRAAVVGTVKSPAPIPQPQGNGTSDEEQEDGLDLNLVYNAAATMQEAGFKDADKLLMAIASWAANNPDTAHQLIYTYILPNEQKG